MGKPAEYEDISIPLFVSGYLAVIVVENLAVHPLMVQHLQELMWDAELYSWEPTRSLHAVWLQQLEQGRVTLADEDAKVKLRRALV